MSPKSRQRRAKWSERNQIEMDLEDRDKDESEVIVWPSANRNRVVQESQASSDWIKWHSKREDRDGLTTGHDQMEDPTTRMVDTHRTAVEQKAKNYLQENARKNFFEKVEDD